MKVKAQPTRSRPRNLVFSCPPIVFLQPKASSIRLRMRWLTAYPACRVVRPSIADERPLVFCATCGHCVHRAQFIDEVLGVVGFVGAQRDRLRPIGARLDHVQRRNPFRMAVGPSQTGVDQKAVAVLHQRMPHEAELGLLARPLAVEPRLRIGGRGVRIVRSPLAAEIRLTVPPARIGRRFVANLRLETFHRRPSFEA